MILLPLIGTGREVCVCVYACVRNRAVVQGWAAPQGSIMGRQIRIEDKKKQTEKDAPPVHLWTGMNWGSGSKAHSFHKGLNRFRKLAKH